MNIFKHFMLLLTFFVSFFVIDGNAQSSYNFYIKTGQEELQKRGLTQGEVRARLIEKGIDVDNVDPLNYANYQTEVMETLDELEAEKKAKSKIKNISSNADSTIEVTDTINTKSVAEAVPEIPETTMKEDSAEDILMKKHESVKQQDSTAIYGHGIFTDNTLKIFHTTDGAKVPDTYVLGKGDEIHISIFGDSQTDIQEGIAADGSIQPDGNSKIFLKGLTLAQARKSLSKSLSKSYLFKPGQMVITLVTARNVLVNVFGEATITGGFNISALNSAYNVLSVAGGPTDIGSVRNIQLIRGAEHYNMDVYAFMNNPFLQFKFDLQNNDILYIPVAKKLVTIKGAVKRPMIYEMKDDETLSSLIKYAGGGNERCLS